MSITDNNINSQDSGDVSGAFLDFHGERYYAIRNVDKMAPFFVSVVSNVDHWLFVSSTGGLTAGRVSPSTSLFPYVTVDKIHDSSPHTGPKTIIRVTKDGNPHVWEPFDHDQDGHYELSRNLYKSLLGDKLCFEEFNHDLQLVFRYTWATSDSYGFVRQCELENLGNSNISADVLDGLQNILPAGTPTIGRPIPAIWLTPTSGRNSIRQPGLRCSRCIRKSQIEQNQANLSRRIRCLVLA